MSLASGTRVGPYEIAAQIGSGGMGVVYRAIDTNLKRAVAIKVLPASVAGDAERLARFQREAEVLASLNHPHIAQIHGLERSDGVTALVMELVEGPTLAERIQQQNPDAQIPTPKGGPEPRGQSREPTRGLPIAEAFAVAKQIAEALEAAHEQGVIHRDLKPANIKVRDDGTVKVLDFGLAKAMDPATSMAAARSMAPTITTPALMTGAGVILGTAAYMSPEQARGRTVDKRADIWAFGAVLYEMLTGSRAFPGEDITETLAAVVKSEPDWEALPHATPPAVQAYLRRCLYKDPRQRVGDIRDVRLAIEGAFDLPGHARGAGIDAAEVQWQAETAVAAARKTFGRRLLIASASALIVGAGIAGAVAWIAARPEPLRVTRTTIATSGDAALSVSGIDTDVAITPDGSRIVYRGNDRILVRSLDQLEPAELTGLNGPRSLFVSPDSQWVGYFDAVSTLKKVSIGGGPAITLAQGFGNPRGATWGEDGSIIFATNTATGGLLRVRDSGGDVETLTVPDITRGELDHYWPEFLPGARAVLFTIESLTRNPDDRIVAVLDLNTKAQKVLVRGASHARYVPTGHLVYGTGSSTLRAIAFDPVSTDVAGSPVQVIENVVTTVYGAADAALGNDGSLIYVDGRSPDLQMSVSAVDRQGQGTTLTALPLDLYRQVRVSPDGTRLALGTADDVWTYDLSRGTPSRLTTDPAQDDRPYWSPDSSRLLFTSFRAGFPEIFWRPADGSGREERFLSGEKSLLDFRGVAWSPDGSQLLMTRVTASVSCSIEHVAIARPSEPKVLIADDFCNDYPAISPDGRWIAYQSNRSGRYEVYVERYPELGGRLQVSTMGGGLPSWSRDGRELFFTTPDAQQMFVVAMQPGPVLRAGRPQPLFKYNMRPPLGGTRPYDLGPDGRFFIIHLPKDENTGPPPSLVLVHNWFEELKRLAPGN